jgi:hypothetical protein
MISILLTSLQWLRSKAGLWLLTIGAVFIGLLTLLARSYEAGRATEKLNSVNNTLKEVQENARVQAEHDSLSAADARKRLLNRWSER